MSFRVQALPLIGLVAVANANMIDLQGRAPTCVRDNCYRAAAAMSASPGPSSASADCISFLRKTLTPDPSTTTVTITNTPTVSVTATSSTTATQTVFESQTTTSTSTTIAVETVTTTITVVANNKRALDARATVGSPSRVPAYASACSGTVRYSSACSCVGVAQTTTTLSASTVVVTVTAFADPTTTTISTATVTLSSTATVTTVVTVEEGATSTSTSTVTSIHTSTVPACNIPTQDARCQQPSNVCCSNSPPGRCYPCTNPGAACIKACDISADCIFGGLIRQFPIVVGFTDDNLCVGYNGCGGCPAAKLLKRVFEQQRSSSAKQLKTTEYPDRTVVEWV